MFQYFLKRILVFVPAFLVISLVVFAFSKMAPGDPITIDPNAVFNQEDYQRQLATYGLDKPYFYFSFTSLAYPNAISKVLIQEHRTTLQNLIAQYGNSEAVLNYYREIGQLGKAIQSVPDSLKGDAYIEIKRIFHQLYINYEDASVTSHLQTIEKNYQSTTSDLAPFFATSIPALQHNYQNIKTNTSRWKLYVPRLQWFGFDNQYHNWITGFVKGDYGNSYRDGRPASKRIKEALGWTIIMNLVAIFFAFLISIPIGVYSAVKKGSFFDRAVSLILFVLFSMPTFWVATLFLVFLTTSEYGAWLDLFPSGGLGNLSADQPFWTRFWDRAAHMVLPIICLTYGALAYLSRQIRGAMIDTINQDYVRTARAKGLSERTIIWRHAFRNSLFPLISIIAMIFPTVLAGSIIVEFIFNIPGMGRLVFDSILSKDWPIVYTVLMLTAVLTMLGNLIGDLLYAWVDPRVEY